jgi:hypothetical protein
MGLFPDIRFAKAKRSRAGKFSASPRAECATAIPETTDCRAAPALLIPLALQISKEAV